MCGIFLKSPKFRAHFEALRDRKVKHKVEEMEVEELRRLWNAGIKSGPSINADTVFTRLKIKYAAMQKQDDAI